MPKRSHIGYYPHFRVAIPILAVNYPRVTHPFAAILKKFLHFFLRKLADSKKESLDLHA